MIDIIIPAYNSHDTIVRTLSSIAMQLNRDELVVTIVNDGGKPYSNIVDIFKPILNIQEIGYASNRGPGFARQYGIDNTKQDFITFIDADDTFYEACSLSLLSKPMKDTSAKFIISPFMQIGKNCEQGMMNANLVWIFGHMYRRSFLNEHNIRFTSTRANEDVGFNNMCNLIAQNEMGAEGGKVLSTPTYEWHYNEASITRRGKDEYEFGICTPGYIYNLHQAYNVAQREGVSLKEIAPHALETAFSCFIYYNVALAKNVPEETLGAIEELSRKFYYEYYKQIQDYISKDEYNIMYTNSYNSKGNHLQGIIFKQTLDNFIDLMFSKPVNNTTYEEIESKVQTIAENL
jgi:glycosyltransferase involved in cell wall biosynthesis